KRPRVLQFLAAQVSVHKLITRTLYAVKVILVGFVSRPARLVQPDSGARRIFLSPVKPVSSRHSIRRSQCCTRSRSERRTRSPPSHTMIPTARWPTGDGDERDGKPVRRPNRSRRLGFRATGQSHRREDPTRGGLHRRRRGVLP